MERGPEPNLSGVQLLTDPTIAALFDKAKAKIDAGDFAGAAKLYGSVDASATEYPTAQFNLGVALVNQGRLDTAIKALEAATKAAPTDARYWSTLGRIRMRRDQFKRAVQAYRKALDLNSENAADWAHLSGALRFLKSYEAAIEAARCALAIDPALEHALIALLHAQMRACDWDGIDAVRTRLRAAVETRIAAGQSIQTRPFQAVVFFEDPAFQKLVSDNEAKRIVAAAGKRGPAATRAAADTIRVGYLSAGFRNHPTGHLAKGLFAAHDRSKVTTIALSLGQDDGSDLRKEIIRSADRFIDIDRFSDAQVGAIIENEGIDVLVDLHGFLQGHRIGIVAHSKAPVSVNYLGFPGTTGAGLHDYILLDPVIAPNPENGDFGEAVVRLPGSYQINDARDFVEQTGLTRADQGLPEDALVFCCFNMPYKIEPQAFDAWCEILKNCSDAVLWLLDEDPVKENLRREAKARGVDPDRLIFGPPVARDKHLQRLALADIGLDTWICGGHTTTTDCLFAGVPVITKPGRSFASRVAASLVSSAGLADCVAADREGYIDFARELALDRDRRAALKRHLRDLGPSQPLFDLPAKVRAMERAYAGMMRRYHEGQTPAPFDV